MGMVRYGPVWVYLGTDWRAASGTKYGTLKLPVVQGYEYTVCSLGRRVDRDFF